MLEESEVVAGRRPSPARREVAITRLWVEVPAANQRRKSSQSASAEQQRWSLTRREAGGEELARRRRGPVALARVVHLRQTARQRVIERQDPRGTIERSALHGICGCVPGYGRLDDEHPALRLEEQHVLDSCQSSTGSDRVAVVEQ